MLRCVVSRKFIDVSEVLTVLHQLIPLMMEAVSTSETSVNLYETTRRNIPEDSHLHTRRHQNLKYQAVGLDHVIASVVIIIIIYSVYANWPVLVPLAPKFMFLVDPSLLCSMCYSLMVILNAGLPTLPISAEGSRCSALSPALMI
jgi:hypothetical protein